MRITTMKQAKIMMGTGTVMAVLGALIYFLTNSISNGLVLIFYAILLYEAVVRSEPGQQIFTNGVTIFPKSVTILPKNKFFLWMFALSMVVLTINSVLELWKFVFAA